MSNYGNHISKQIFLAHIYIIHVYISCRHGLVKQYVIPIQDLTFGTLFWLDFGTLRSLCQLYLVGLSKSCQISFKIHKNRFPYNIKRTKLSAAIGLRQHLGYFITFILTFEEKVMTSAKSLVAYLFGVLQVDVSASYKYIAWQHLFAHSILGHSAENTTPSICKGYMIPHNQWLTTPVNDLLFPVSFLQINKHCNTKLKTPWYVWY